jgi:hypothetical protein
MPSWGSVFPGGDKIYMPSWGSALPGGIEICRSDDQLSWVKCVPSCDYFYFLKLLLDIFFKGSFFALVLIERGVRY